MSRVKAYRKLHPRTTQIEAMKKLAGKKPAKKHKKTTVHERVKKIAKAASPRKRSIVKTERVTTIGSHKRKTGSGLQRGISISRRIDDLELLLKNTAGTTAKNHVKRLINAEHDKLDAITKHLKTA